MKTRLKDLSVTSVDLVDQGANPDAYIQLFKRGETGAVENPEGIVEKEAQTFSDNITREQLREVTSEMFDNCCALSDSFASIICDQDASADKKEALILQSLEEFAQVIHSAAAQWAKGEKSAKPREQAEAQKSTARQEALAKLLGQYVPNAKPTPAIQEPRDEKEDSETMKIDKSKMTPEEQATLAEFEKKYGIEEPGERENNPPADGVEKGTAQPVPAPTPDGGALHPDVAKALSDFQTLAKRQSEEIEALKKSLEIERLTAAAQKYEILGKKAPELAEKLYKLKKAGGTVYDDYTALLDESVTAVTKSGLFGEIGSSRQGSAGTEQTLGIKAAELAKSAQGGMTTPDAIIKAWEENPELAAQYDTEYFGLGR